jgi:hypothetical protein
MSVTPKEEPLEPGKKRVKVAKKKTPGKKATAKAYTPKPTSIEKGATKPKPIVKLDLLKGVNYELTEVEGSERVTDKQTHLLVMKRNDKVFKYALYERPDDRFILNLWNTCG